MLKFEHNLGASRGFTCIEFGASGHVTAILKAHKFEKNRQILTDISH